MDTQNCDRMSELLSDYLDDELGASDRELVRAHLETCEQCTETLAAYRRVVGHASALEDRPAADLWPGIAARIGARVRVEPVRPPRPVRFRFRRVPQLLAAGIGLAVVVAGALWFADDIRLPTVAAAPEAGAGAPDVLEATFVDPSATRYDAAIEDLVAALDAEQETLDPRTVRIVRQNLAIIDAALERARQALLADPGSEYLREHVEVTKRQKLELLQQVTMPASEL